VRRQKDGNVLGAHHLIEKVVTHVSCGFLKAFAEFKVLDKIPSPREIGKWPDDWALFRCRQTETSVAKLAKIIRDYDPGIKVIDYDYIIWYGEASERMFMRGCSKNAAMNDKWLDAHICSFYHTCDRSAFNAIADMVKATGHKNAGIMMPKFEPFPGKLASKGGLVLASSTSNWDNPCNHWGLIEPCGGTFHTGKDTDAWIVVQLPRQVNVTGVVLITNPGNLHRLNNMKIQVSEDGKEWKDVHQFGPCNGRVLSADLQDKLPLAKYVRILRPGGPEFFHLNGIYVYGNQAA
jgi:hypothetical protein